MNKTIINQSRLEQAEQRELSKGKSFGYVSYDPTVDKIYNSDARMEGGVDKSTFMIDVAAYKQAKALLAKGEVDKANKLRIFSNLYLQMRENITKVAKIKEDTYAPTHVIANSLVGAAGPTATTDYETIRRDGDLLAGILGQEHTNEDYQAINIASKESKNSVRFEYISRTSNRIVAQRNIGDNEEALPLRHTYTTGHKDIFAYGLQFISSLRDNIDTKADIVADFTRQVPDSILAAKNEDVLTLLNAITGNNQGDWDSFSSGIAAVSAAAQVQVAEDAVKAYGRPLVCVMDSTSWRGYMQNMQGAYFAKQADNIANQSTSTASAKTGQLLGNPGVTYFIDDGLTAATYVLAAQPSYMKYFQAMVVMSSVTNEKTPGKAEQRFWYDFAGFEETNSSAQYKGTSTLT